MQTVIIVVHLMVVVALVAVVLLQRSEGGALGIGGGGNFMASRGSGNVLTRATAILAATFFATSMILTLLARETVNPGSILDANPGAVQGDPNAPPAAGGGGGGVLDLLPGRAGAPVIPPADPVPAAPNVPAAGAADAPAITPPVITLPPGGGFGIPLAPQLPGLPPAAPPADQPLFPLNPAPVNPVIPNP